MYRPQQLAAAFLSAALLCTSGIALADKGGAKGNPHGGPPGQSGSAPGQSNGNNGQGQGPSKGPGGIGGPQSAPGPSMNSSFGRNGAMQGDVDAHASAGGGSSSHESSSDRAAGQAEIVVKVNGAEHTFVVTPAALKSLQAHKNQKNLIFFSTNGKDITAVSAVGEKMDMRVVSRSGNTFTLESADGQERLIALDAKTAARLHVKVGANLQLTAMSARNGRVVALDLVKKHDFDKFARRTGTGVDVDVAKLDIDRAKTDIDVAKSRKVKKADVDVVKADIDKVKTDIDASKGKKSKKLDIDVAKLDNDEHNLQVASSGCGHGASRNGNPAFANQMAKDAANDASGHNPPGLPHECVNPAGHTRGFCKSSSSASICGGGSMGGSSDVDVAKSDIDTNGHKAKNHKSGVDVAKSDVDTTPGSMGKCGHGSSRNSNPAFANQMAKDAANDASGHNPPGLPHECVNPAGHTRGFCKSSSSESICGGGSGSGGSDTEVASNLTKPCAPGTSSKSHNNPAFANQMAKDAANDASGHNPPGLPHECVNPAGHTRGFCKSSDSSSPAMCGGGSSGSESGVAPSELHGGIARNAAAPGTGTAAPRLAAAPVNGGTARPAIAPARGFTTSGSATRGPGAPVGFIPAGGGQFASGGGTRGATRGATRGVSPTHVLGASTGPTRGRRIAALPTRVLPVAIKPVGKRRCVWYKTAVLGASTGGHYIVGTSAIRGKPVLHKKCR